MCNFFKFQLGNDTIKEIEMVLLKKKINILDLEIKSLRSNLNDTTLENDLLKNKIHSINGRFTNLSKYLINYG